MERLSMSVTPLERPAVKEPRIKPRPILKVSPQGEDGLYSQCWYPVCRSRDVQTGEVIARKFLGGQVAIFRGEDGNANVVSSYCVHMGADLSGGCVEGNTLRCAFHGWQYSGDGRCIGTAIGAQPPKSAAIFAFPTRERWGLIFAFNGEEADWELPDLDYPDEELMVIEGPTKEIKCDPEMITANAFDWQHFATLHDFHSDENAPGTVIDWEDHWCGFTFVGKHWLNEDTTYRIEIHGTNFYTQQGTLDGYWYTMLNPMGQPAPQEMKFYMQILVPKGDGSDKAEKFARYKAEAILDMETRFIAQDIPILNKLHFAPGFLIKEDKQFVEYLSWLKKFPRGNPAMNYLK
ncbi:MAG: Rieske 2Fe-2S domain-containing protein [Pseudomonadota bacterium]